MKHNNIFRENVSNIQNLVVKDNNYVIRGLNGGICFTEEKKVLMKYILWFIINVSFKNE